MAKSIPGGKAPAPGKKGATKVPGEKNRSQGKVNTGKASAKKY